MQSPQPLALKYNVHSIAIVGAGFGGLVLARILQMNGVACIVYEADGSKDSQGQGGSLDIHTHSGQVALREAGLLDQFSSLIRAQGDDMRIVDKNGTFWFDEVADGGHRPEIDRAALRGLLISSLNDGSIMWGHKVIAANTLPNHQHQLTFESGSSVVADILVGADGTWSSVRKLVSDAQPTYSGISFVDMFVADVDERHKELSELVGRGSLFALSDSKGLFAQRNGNGSIRVYAALRVDADWPSACGVDWQDAAAVRAMLLGLFSGWSASLLDLIRYSDAPLVSRQIHVLPIGHSWKRVAGVTLLGDAAHVMSPFAGEGANLAMQDAAELAFAIIAHCRAGLHGDLDAVLLMYEQDMFSRASTAAAESVANLEICMRGDAPAGLVRLMKWLGSQPSDFE